MMDSTKGCLPNEGLTFIDRSKKSRYVACCQSLLFLFLVPFVDDSQTFQGQEFVDLFDHL
jgi:hypothetical protein